MGLIVHIYRPAHFADCTNGGISGVERNAHGLCLVNVEGPFEAGGRYPAAMLVEHSPFGREVGKRLCRIVPAEHHEGAWRPATGHWMMGGHYAATSDGRFNVAVVELLGSAFYGAVPIHDRTEA